MRKIAGLLLLVWVMLSLVSCGQVDSDKVDQSEIYTAYNTSYSAEDEKLTVRASFTIGGSVGTYVWLSNESDVRVNGNQMRGDDTLFNQISYQYSQNIGPSSLSDRTIRYKNEEGQEYSNSTNLPGAVSVSGSSTAYDDRSYTFNWNASGSIWDQTLTIYIFTGTTSWQLHSKGLDENSGSYEVDIETLQKVGGNEFKVQACRRKYDYDIDSPSAGGHLTSVYCSKKKTVNLIKVGPTP